jgi:hypothetical protein
MKKIYLIVQHYYDEVEIHDAYETKENAEAAALNWENKAHRENWGSNYWFEVKEIKVLEAD